MVFYYFNSEYFFYYEYTYYDNYYCVFILCSCVIIVWYYDDLDGHFWIMLVSIHHRVTQKIIIMVKIVNVFTRMRMRSLFWSFIRSKACVFSRQFQWFLSFASFVLSVSLFRFICCVPNACSLSLRSGESRGSKQSPRGFILTSSSITYCGFTGIIRKARAV